MAISTTLYVGTWWLDEVIAFVREHNPSATIIVGGPYIYNQSVFSSAEELGELFEHLDADVYVISQQG